MKRKMLAMLLSLAMLFTLAPTAFAAGSESQPTEMSGNCGATQEDNVTWTLKQNNESNESPTYTLTISGTGAMADYAVGKAPWHVELGQSKADREKINTIVLPNGLTRIGDNAFLQASVTNVEIPNTVISIGTNAFWNCNTIKTTLPASVQELGATAFYGTFVVNVDASSPYFCSEKGGKILYNKDKTTLYQVSQDYTGEFTIPSTVTTINGYAMYECKDTSGKLVIPDSVQTIGQAAFYGTGFTALDLGKGVKKIGTSAFNTCAKMTGDLVIPASVTNVGESAFHSTGFDGVLNIQAQIEEIPVSEFSGAAFTSVVFSGGVKRIDNLSFRGCTELTSVNFSDNVESIGDYAFFGCTKLASVTFGKGLQTIGKYAFANSGLSGEMTFPRSLETIKEFAFSSCSGITGITIPEGKISIEYAAFYNDIGVQNVKIPLSETTFNKLTNDHYYIFTQGGSMLNTLVIGAAPKDVPMYELFAGSLNGLKTVVLGTGVTDESFATYLTNIENGLYPNTLSVGSSQLSRVATKYAVADNKLEKGKPAAMLTFETPVDKAKPNITYHSSSTNIIEVNQDGVMSAVGSVGQTATVEAQYEGTTFAKVDVTIGKSAGGAFYSIDPVIADQTYTGSALEPAVKVTKNGEEITKDYFTVKYDNNTDVGTATATVKVDDTVIGTATFNIVKATPAISISADPATMSGSGTVKLTVTKAPTDAVVSVTCDDTSVKVKDNNDSTYTVALPNTTKTYNFKAALAESANYTAADSTCTVSVTRRSSSSGSNSSNPTYSVTTPSKSENGKVSLDKSTAKKGDTVTVTVTPDAGYQLDKLTVTDKNGNVLKLTDKGDGKYSFTMPDGKVEIKAVFAKKVETSPFDDVSADAYYNQAVQWAQEKGITDGISSNLFGPKQPCTRSQIVTFLWRAAGSPEPKGTAAGMTDVVPGSYYAKAVAWAVENGITTGTAEGTFSPDATCTRAQAVTFLARAQNATATGKTAFSDVPADSYFADAVAWAQANGVTTGTSETTFSPDNDCTRAQIVTFLYRANQGT